MEEIEARQKLLDAALNHVAFDGWSDVTFAAAVDDSGVAPALAKALLPRGGVDLALAYHRAGDAAMVAALQAAGLDQMRFRDRIAYAVMTRLELADREAVRRGISLFALPQHAAEGSRAMWGTADAIWTALGDSSQDLNYYTKRTTLSAVYGASVLFWLGDESEGFEATRAFLDRRIEGVMRFEKIKANLAQGPVGKILAGPISLLSKIRAPKRPGDLPGRS